MKVVILAGGLGTRLAEETGMRPKPMVEIGDKPIIWHIMKIYSSYGLRDFIICLGYKGYMIKEYFSNYFLHTSDVTFDISGNKVVTHSNAAEPWRVTLVDTGSETMTGGRIKRIESYLDHDDMFCMTYGDGLGNVNIEGLLSFHGGHEKLATVTAVHPPRRFGVMEVSETGMVEAFEEKPEAEGGWVSGGFFVLSRKVLGLIDGDRTVWEREPLRHLAKSRQLQAYRHPGFWQPMDTIRDKQLLEDMWRSGNAPWKVW